MSNDNRYISLRMVEGAGIAIKKTDGPNANGDAIPARYDLFAHAGGFEWGYKGSGPRSLAWALSAHLYPTLSVQEQSLRVETLLELVSTLASGHPHDLRVNAVMDFVASRHG